MRNAKTAEQTQWSGGRNRHEGSGPVVRLRRHHDKHLGVRIVPATEVWSPNGLCMGMRLMRAEDPCWPGDHRFSPAIHFNHENNVRTRLEGMVSTQMLPSSKQMRFLEDNIAMLRISKTGRNPTMRHIARAHRISVAWLHDVYQ